MSKIEELLKNEKVEWKKLGDVCEIIGGSSFPKSFQGKISGKYAFYKVSDMNKCTVLMNNSENYIDDDDLKKLKAKLIPKNSLIFPKVGATLATNKKRLLIKESCIDNNILALVAKEIHYKYLYHIFAKEQLLSFANGKGAVPSIDMEKLKNFKIPIPSIETQEKIVKTLDKFTNYVTELQAELQDRTKQYEYYRDMLLSEEYLNKITAEIISSDNKVKVTTLGECVNIVVGGDVPKNNFSPTKTEEYQIPIFSNGIEEKSLYGYTNIAKVVEKSVTVSARGTIGYVSYKETPYFPIVRLLCLIPKKEMEVKYLYYFLQKSKINHKETGIPSLTTDMLKKIKIILPTIEFQNKIVEILDKFQSLLIDTKGLLPQEIEQRQKQYEYYREKLLTFDENSVKRERERESISL